MRESKGHQPSYGLAEQICLIIDSLNRNKTLRMFSDTRRTPQRMRTARSALTWATTAINSLRSRMQLWILEALIFPTTRLENEDGCEMETGLMQNSK